MNKILSVVFCLVIGCAQIPEIEVSANDPLISYDAQRVLFYKGQPFLGYIVEYYENGTLMSKTGYKDGLKEAESIAYYPNGQIQSIRAYAKGEKHGVHRGYYEDGSPEFEYTFVNGKSEGTHVFWYPSGEKAQEMNFVNGQEFGSQKVWRIDGKLRSNYVVREDGRRYGLVGIKRCKNIDTENEEIAPLTAEIYEK
jgi:antitoxin component YwqK of YwqJK toxin-antitoxin module